MKSQSGFSQVLGQEKTDKHTLMMPGEKCIAVRLHIATGNSEYITSHEIYVPMRPNSLYVGLFIQTDKIGVV